MKLQEFCVRCQKVTESLVKVHASGTEFLCSICNAQVDFLHDEDLEDTDEWDEDDEV